jgi:uncharacterized protein YecE (DUF72 family)
VTYSRRLVGTSGWVYPSWRETVYTAGTPQREWLRHYASLFPTVEVNATFYRLASRATVARWAEAVPSRFQFVVKGSRYLTHIRRLEDVTDGLRRFFASVEPLGDKLTAVLWQLPPTFPADVDRLSRFLDALPRHPQPAFEFRHASWRSDVVGALLDGRGAMTVAVSGAQADADRPVTGGPVTGRRAYVRFHGLAGGYAHDYTDDELAPWARFVAAAPAALAYFNNDAMGMAVKNALRFTELVAALAEPRSRKAS